MKKFWINAALMALGMLTSRKFIDDVKDIVQSLITKDNTNKEKKQKAIESVKGLGFKFSNWLIEASIELALGWLKMKYPRLFR